MNYKTMDFMKLKLIMNFKKAKRNMFYVYITRMILVNLS